VSVLLLVTRLVLVVIFTWSGVAKLADWTGSRRAMLDFGVPVRLARQFALLVPLAELVVAGCSSPPPRRGSGRSPRWLCCWLSPQRSATTLCAATRRAVTASARHPPNPSDRPRSCARETLLLFWDPGCGFCADMLPALRERDATQDEPALVVISTGDVSENRAMGLRAPVLLDDANTVGPSYGISGTPMAILVDSAGRIASEVAAGAATVLELGGRPVTTNCQTAGAHTW
jgi:hypothetical protein